MSTLVETNNTLVFGHQSPLYRMDDDKFVKEHFIRTMFENCSQVYRKRAWNIYQLANRIFPSKVVEINENIKSGIGKFISSFVTSNMQQIDALVLDTPRQRYLQGEIALTQEIAKATGVKATLVMTCDSEKEDLSHCHRITTYLTRGFNKGDIQELEVNWSNKFFSFKNPENLSILIVIPKQYVASLVRLVLSSSVKELNHSSLDNMAIKANLIDYFTIDLIKSFFQAIYTDGYRNRVVSDIYLLNKIIQREGFNLSTEYDEGYDKAVNSMAKYSNELKQFKNSSNLESLVYKMLSLCSNRNGGVNINPYDFYYSIIDTPNAQFMQLISHIPSFNRLDVQSHGYNFTFSNNLSDMGIFGTDKERDIIVYGIKLMRFIPVLLFLVYVMGQGAHHVETKTILGSVNSILTNMMGYRASNAWSSPLIEFIVNNIRYCIDVTANEISSPLNNTLKAQQVITSSIDRFGFDESERGGKDLTARAIDY